jgi:hypothetical protein
MYVYICVCMFIRNLESITQALYELTLDSIAVSVTIIFFFICCLLSKFTFHSRLVRRGRRVSSGVSVFNQYVIE